MATYETAELTVTVAFKAGLKSEGEDGPKHSYKAEITYASVKDAVEKAAKYTTWVLQRRARAGELPTDETVTVNGEGEYKQSLKQQIAKMDREEAMALFLELKAQFDAKATKTK